MFKSIVVLFICLFTFSGCNTTKRALAEARVTITDLEQLNAERAARNEELERLYNAERIGNQELKRIIEKQQSELDGYFESERKRIEREKLIVNSLTGIFGEGSDIIEELIRGYSDIAESIGQTEPVE